MIEFDAQNLPREMVERAARGELVVIVREGRPVARVLPALGETEPEHDEAAAKVMAGFRHMREAAAIGGVHWGELAGQGRR